MRDLTFWIQDRVTQDQRLTVQNSFGSQTFLSQIFGLGFAVSTKVESPADANGSRCQVNNREFFLQRRHTSKIQTQRTGSNDFESSRSE